VPAYLGCHGKETIKLVSVYLQVDVLFMAAYNSVPSASEWELNTDGQVRVIALTAVPHLMELGAVFQQLRPYINI